MTGVIIRALRMVTRTEVYQLHVYHPEHPKMRFEGDLTSALTHVSEELCDVDADVIVTFIYQAKPWWSGSLAWFRDPACPRTITQLVEQPRREPWLHTKEMP